MMVVTVCPMFLEQGTSASVFSADTEVSPVEIVDNGDGSFSMSMDYLEKMFGIKDSKPSSVKDPVGHDALGIEPLEIAYWYGGSNGHYTARDPVTNTDVIESTEISSTDSNHSVGFSAGLTRNNAGQHVADASSRWNTVEGFAKWDWYCSLYYDNTTGHLMLHVAHPGDQSSISVDTATGNTPYPTSEIDKVSSLQSRNILNYCVGDFDGDGNEEIAVHHWYGIYVFGLDQSTLKLQLEQSFNVPRYDGYENTLFTPVSMDAGDVDYDGTSEIIITRGYYQKGYPGSGEFTDLGVLNCVTNGSEWIRVSITDPKNSASSLDSIMTSVTSGDVDNDGKPEIVIGGYLWDNTNTSGSYTKDWARSAGELYLAVIQPEELMSGNTVFRYVTVLGDDNGTATTRYQDNSDFNSKYKLQDHNLSDTSIYLTDTNDNPSGLCRSVNWCNWTIPLAAGSLSGYKDGTTFDQVYFDKWFYGISNNNFTVYKKTTQLGKVMDDNNVICTGINVGQITTRDASDFNGTDQFLVFYGADLEKHFDSGWTEWVYVIYSETDSDTTKSTYSVDLPNGYRDLRDWGLYNVGRVFCGNYNNDTYYVELQYRMFTYTDPTVIAMIAPVPYDQDLADVLFGGADAIGESEYTKFTEHEDEEGSSISFDIGPCGSLDFIVEAEAELKYTHEESWSSSKTISLSTSYSSAEESIALYVMPTDIYIYKVFEPTNDGKYTVSYQMVPFYRDPVQTMMDYEEYSEFIDNYNSIMGSAIPDFVPMPKIQFSDNVQGDISSYTSVPSDPLVSVDVYYKGSGYSSRITQSVDLSESHGFTYANGAELNISVQAKFLVATAGAGFSMSASDATTTTDVSGMGFSSTLSQGMEVNYLGDPSEAHSVLSQYTMSGTFWAEMRSMEINGETQDYVYVGYTVNDYTTAPKMGSLVPDVYIPGGDDENDPYNPTDDSVCLLATIPGTVERPDRTADSYVLQVKWQGRWYDVDGNILGFSTYVDEGDYWTEIDGRLTPSAYDTQVWLKVDGLSNVSNLDFEFRLDSVRGDAGSARHNPCLAVTAYKDTRITTNVGCSTMVGSTMTGDYGVFDHNGTRVVLIDDDSVYSVEGRHLVFVKTELTPGDIVELWHYNEDTGFKMLKRDLGVCYEGYLVYDIDNTEPDNGPWMYIGATLLLVFGLAFMAVFNIRRH